MSTNLNKPSVSIKLSINELNDLMALLDVVSDEVCPGAYEGPDLENKQEIFGTTQGRVWELQEALDRF